MPKTKTHKKNQLQDDDSLSESQSDNNTSDNENLLSNEQDNSSAPNDDQEDGSVSNSDNENPQSNSHESQSHNKKGKVVHKLSIFIHRRDLRLEDNTGLFHALRLSEQVVPCFVFDTDQIDPSKNSYFTHNQVQFMIESLKDLNEQLEEHKSRVFFFHGEKKNTFKHMLETIKPDAVFVNEDYTLYSKKRDKILQDLCDDHNVEFYSYHDYTLLPKDQVLLPSKGFYQKFTAYYNHAQEFKVREIEKNNFKNYYPASKNFKGEYPTKDIDKFYKKNDRIEVHGGRKEGLKILDNMNKWKDYGKERDNANYPTTKLSAYNKFGVISIREVYFTVKKLMGKSAELIRQLFWRDFYYYVAYYHPHVFGDAYKESYQSVYGVAEGPLFDKWKKGETGCPIVDAAMRQLNTTGYMANRLRLITSNYLVKDLLVDWREGERYFAQQLVDYDASQNNGNWQWTAGCGADAQPYFRIFNPKLQSEKFDKDCEYILEWVPELEGVDHKHIHHWDEHYKKYAGKVKYFDPCVFHDKQKEKCLKMYKKGLYGEKFEEADDEEGIEAKAEGMGEEERLEGATEKQAAKEKKRGKKRKAKDDEEDGPEIKKVKKSPNEDLKTKNKGKDLIQDARVAKDDGGERDRRKTGGAQARKKANKDKKESEEMEEEGGSDSTMEEEKIERSASKGKRGQKMEEEVPRGRSKSARGSGKKVEESEEEEEEEEEKPKRAGSRRSTREKSSGGEQKKEVQNVRGRRGTRA